MGRTTRLVSSLLLAAGTVLVFIGLSAALGYTVTGMLASVAAIAALLFAGGVWFSAGPGSSGPHVLIFDETLTLTSGQPLLAQFPEHARVQVRTHCLAALAGQRSHFVVAGRTLHATPIVSGDGAILYGALVETVPARMARAAMADLAVQRS